ncbi:hypothetical protein C8Q76DRAFT_42158 [Earliella scabrosa]|nr:hypothetical protein C8Q76DRAFT_42158 [Earliella scabrosa]
MLLATYDRMDPNGSLPNASTSSLPYDPSSASTMTLADKEEEEEKSGRGDSHAGGKNLFMRWYRVARRKLRSHAALFLGILFAGIVACNIAVGWSFRLTTFDISDGDVIESAIVQLTANLVDIDHWKQQITLEWNIDYDCVPIGCPDVNVYFDPNTLRSDSDSYTTRTNVKPDPIFSVVGANVLTMKNHSDRRPSALSFRTVLAMTNAGTHRTLQSYPYDKYRAELVFFAEQASNNASMSIAIVKTTGIAVGFNVRVKDTGPDVVDNFGTVVKSIEITRGPVVRLYAIFIVIVVWLVTLTFMAICVLNVFFGKGINNGVLVLPMGTLFAFTQLRSTLPGAPSGFGAAIDFVGILPCLALLTFCSIFMTGVFIWRNPEHDVLDPHMDVAHRT